LWYYRNNSLIIYMRNNDFCICTPKFAVLFRRRFKRSAEDTRVVGSASMETGSFVRSSRGPKKIFQHEMSSSSSTGKSKENWKQTFFDYQLLKRLLIARESHESPDDLFVSRHRWLPSGRMCILHGILAKNISHGQGKFLVLCNV